uniref:Uncharacterized protein n=1 Tax=Fagus sylvatica TaxID=28930 RepID=A0A2N9IUA8_FAGSY
MMSTRGPKDGSSGAWVSDLCSGARGAHGPGFGDKVLAELGINYETVDEFDAKLKENGVGMPDYFVCTLLTIIHAILPPKPKLEKESKKESIVTPCRA